MQQQPAPIRTKLASNVNVSPDIDKDIAQFKRDGFFGPIKIYEPEEAAAILREIRIKNHDRANATYKSHINYDRHLDISHLSQHISHPTIIKYLTAILGPDVLLWRTEFFTKFPGSKGTQWHQIRDYSYANGKPQLVPTKSEWNAFIDLTVWTTFTSANKSNGCLTFLPGSHNKRYYDEHKLPKAGRDVGYNVTTTDGEKFFGYDFEDFKVDPDWDPTDENIVELEMNPGEAVIFASSCVHGSLPNTTERETRFAFVGRYAATHVRVYPDQDTLIAHGEELNLSNYGSVLVAGKNEYNHNRMKTENNLGEPFVVI